MESPRKQQTSEGSSPPPPTFVLETALYAEDLDAAQDFYGGLIGLELQSRVGDRHVFFRIGEAMLLVFNPTRTEIASGGSLSAPPHGARGAGHVCFAADTAALDQWCERFEAAGVSVEADFQWPNGARSIYVRDPAMNSVEFAEPHLWTAPAKPARP